MPLTADEIAERLIPRIRAIYPVIAGARYNVAFRAWLDSYPGVLQVRTFSNNLERLLATGGRHAEYLRLITWMFDVDRWVSFLEKNLDVANYIADNIAVLNACSKAWQATVIRSEGVLRPLPVVPGVKAAFVPRAAQPARLDATAAPSRMEPPKDAAVAALTLSPSSAPTAPAKAAGASPAATIAGDGESDDDDDAPLKRIRSRTMSFCELPSPRVGAGAGTSRSHFFPGSSEGEGLRIHTEGDGMGTFDKDMSARLPVVKK